MTVLVTGFGPFPGVAENPSGALARALDGRSARGVRVVGLEIPTSYARAVALTVQAARAHGAILVLGTGVAVGRAEPELERIGRRALGPRADVDGVCAPELEGPEQVLATLDVDRWAAALGCGTSEDAGGYVCNAWLYGVARALAPVPVGFLHVPASGMDPDRVLGAIASTATGDTLRPPTTRARGGLG